jgi:hypothetical protein
MTVATAMSSVNAMPANAPRVLGLIELVAEERPIVMLPEVSLLRLRARPPFDRDQPPAYRHIALASSSVSSGSLIRKCANTWP